MSRFLARTRGWVALVLVLALLVPVGRWAADEVAFGASGAAVEEELGEDASLVDAMLLVRSVGCAGQVSTGSAFALEVDGRPVIVTNRHVVEAARSVSVRRLSGGPVVAVDVIRTAGTADVAVLELAADEDPPRRLVAGGPTDIGQDVRMVGFPGGRPATSAGSVTAVTEARLVIDAPVAAGASGAPVLDAAGQVVGQVFATTRDGRGVATPVGQLLRAIASTSELPAC